MSNRNKILGIILVVLILICIGILCIWGYNILNSDSNPETEQSRETSTQEKNLGGKEKKSSNKSSKLDAIQADTVSKEKRYMEDYEIIGELEIPKISLKTNILSETTKRSLEIAVAQIYTTAGLNKPGNTVIYGHNYRNSLFFSRNSELEIGDKFYIIDNESGKKTYTIYDKFETTSTDTSFYAKTAEDTAGKCEATLSTCTDDASSTDRRLIILGREE